MKSVLTESMPQQDAEVRPYLRLWAEVMRLGVQDFCNARARGGRQTNPHTVWFWSDTNEAGSFVWLCDLFNLHPPTARAQVMKTWRSHVERKQAHNTRGRRNGR